MEKIGLIIGKFAPLHKGHEYLIKTALETVDKLYILIYETDLINIDINIRQNWINGLFGCERIKTIKAINPPKQFGMDDISIKIQLDYIEEILHKEKIEKISHVFSSEEYGKSIAKRLNAKNILVDKERIKVPINATNIRKDLQKFKSFLSKNVYEDLKYNL